MRVPGAQWGPRSPVLVPMALSVVRSAAMCSSYQSQVLVQATLSLLIASMPSSAFLEGRSAFPCVVARTDDVHSALVIRSIRSMKVYTASYECRISPMPFSAMALSTLDRLATGSPNRSPMSSSSTSRVCEQSISNCLHITITPNSPLGSRTKQPPRYKP